MGTDYIDETVNYEKQLNLQYKKNNGIFYTDIKLAEKMIQQLRISKNATIFDPCCGTGSFLVASKNNGIRNYFGADQDKDAIEKLKQHITNVNAIVADTLGNTGLTTLKKLGNEPLVDFIVGNPPYAPINEGNKISSNDYSFLKKVSESGNNLFIAALLRAFELVNVNGIISYIIPKNFLHIASYSLLRREILKDKTVLSIVDLGAYFKNVRGEQIILTIKNNVPTIEHQIIIKKLINNEFAHMSSIEQSFYKDEILLFNCEKEYLIYKKMKTSYHLLGDICKGYVGRGKSKSEFAVVGKEIRKFGYKSISLPEKGNKIFIQNIYSAEAGIIAAFGGELEASETVTVLTDGDEKMCRYLLGILHSRLCNYFLFQFCYNKSKLTMHTDAKYLKKIPLLIKDDESFNKIIEKVHDIESAVYMSNEWFKDVESLNSYVYEAYELTEDEAIHIDSEMMLIQSKRWLKNG